MNRVKWAESLVTLLFPAHCYICDKRLNTNQQYICQDCIDQFRFLKPPFCRKCGACLKTDVPECKKCGILKRLPDNIRVYSVLYFNNTLKKAVHLYKYKNYQWLKDKFSCFLIDFIRDYLLHTDIDFITFIPAHRIKEKERGYNQTKVLAECISNKLDMPYIPLLIYTRYAKSQTRLSKYKRLKNVKDVFKPIDKSISLKGKNVILIDDILTTGATILEAAKVLSNSFNINKLTVLTLARGIT